MATNKPAKAYVGSSIPMDLKEKLVSISLNEDRTISYIIKNILQDHIDDYMKDQGNLS